MNVAGAIVDVVELRFSGGDGLEDLVLLFLSLKINILILQDLIRAREKDTRHKTQDTPPLFVNSSLIPPLPLQA